MNICFSNRRHAGEMLARKLLVIGIVGNPVILALPRGAVPVAFEIALRFDASLDVLSVRKLGVPGQEELAMGAVATGGFRYINRTVVDLLKISADVIDAVADTEERELHRREQYYRQTSAPPCVEGRLVIVVDDGVATGSTMLAAVNALKCAGAASIIAAAPVAARSAVAALRKVADRVVVLATPDPFYGVARWYQNFSQVTDEEVREFLRTSREAQLMNHRH
jgi:predicted phosphoribosyltransferase